jgi:nitroreductase
MDVFEAIGKRRTIRKFSAPPSEQQVERLLSAGAMSPSAMDRRPWFVVTVTDPQTREDLAEIKKRLNATFTPDTENGRALLKIQKNAFRHSTSLLVYTYAPEPAQDHRFDVGSAWLLIGTVCVAAAAEGLGTQIFSYWGEAENEVDRLLGVPEGFRQVSGINIGVPDPDVKPPAKAIKPLARWVFRERWPV